MFKGLPIHYANRVILSPQGGRRISFLGSFAPAGLRMTSGQAMVEFSFCVILVFILFVGLIKVFVWTGRDLVERRRTHERVLRELSSGGREQVRPVFFYSSRFNAAIDSNLFGIN